MPNKRTLPTRILVVRKEAMIDVKLARIKELILANPHLYPYEIRLLLHPNREANPIIFEGTEEEWSFIEAKPGSAE